MPTMCQAAWSHEDMVSHAENWGEEKSVSQELSPLKTTLLLNNSRPGRFRPEIPVLCHQNHVALLGKYLILL